MNNEKCTAEIKKSNTFSIHGLWPSFSSEKRMSDCNTGSKINVNIKGTTLDSMNTYWVSLTGPNKNFWNHEYNKHGYCYTERYKLTDEQLYFESAVKLFQQHSLDQMMIQAIGDLKISESKEQQFTYEMLYKTLQNARRDLFFQISCKVKDDKQYVFELHLYFDLNLNPKKHEKRSNCNKSKPIFVIFK